MAGHLVVIKEDHTAFRLAMSRNRGKRPVETSRYTWKNNVSADVGGLGVAG